MAKRPSGALSLGFALLAMALLCCCRATPRKPFVDGHTAADTADYGQSLDGLPDGLHLAAPAHYSFACATAPDQAIWFTEFNRRRLCRYDPATGTRTEPWSDLPGAYGIAIAANGDLYVGQDLGDAGHPGQVVRVDATTGRQSVVVRDLTRPRQVALDAGGHLYVVCEAGCRQTQGSPCVLRLTIETGSVEVWARDLRTPQGVAVGTDGTVFVTEYGRPGIEPGRVLKLGSGEPAREIASGLWQARGACITAAGLYVTTESNRGDQGNSGLLALIELPSGRMRAVLTGLDYPQFPGADAAGRVWLNLNRDSWLANFDPQPTCRGTIAVQARVGPQRFRSRIARFADGRAAGWLRIPARRLDLSGEELYRDRGDPEHPQPGLFALPSAAATLDGRWADCRVVALRGHAGKRYPMSNPGSPNEAPAPGFHESPIAYLVYVEGRP